MKLHMEILVPFGINTNPDFFFQKFWGTAIFWAFALNFTVISLENTMKDQRNAANIKNLDFLRQK